MRDQTGHRPPGNFELHGLCGRVLLDGESLLTNSPADHPDSIGTPEGHPTLRAFLGVPLKQSGRTTGLIALADRDGGYTDREREIVERLAPTIVQAFGRARAEEALRRREEDSRFLADVVENADRLWRRAPDRRLVLFNQAFADLTGSAHAELEERVLTWSSDLTPPEWRQMETRLLAGAVNETQGGALREGVPAQRRQSCAHRAPGAAVLRRRRRPAALWPFLSDITGRKRAEAAIRASQAQLHEAAAQRQLALDAAKLGWWRYDPQTKVSSYDEGYRTIFDVTGSSGRTSGWLNACRRRPAGCSARVEAALGPVRPKPYATEYRIYRSDGSVRWVQVVRPWRPSRARAPSEAYHQPRRRTIQDVAERKRAEEVRQLLLEESQTQAEELQTQSEELRVQGDELRRPADEQLSQRHALPRESERSPA